MSGEIIIRIEGAEALYRRLGIDAINVIAGDIQKSAYNVEAKFKIYPAPPSPGEWAAKTSKRQKAAFFAKLRNGEWTGRTGQYGAGWSTETERSAGVVASTVSNPVRYAGFVGGEETQARFHRGRWPTDFRLLNEELPILEGNITRSVLRAYVSG